MKNIEKIFIGKVLIIKNSLQNEWKMTIGEVKLITDYQCNVCGIRLNNDKEYISLSLTIDDAETLLKKGSVKCNIGQLQSEVI